MTVADNYIRYIYIIARLSGLVVKPGVLLVLNRFGYVEVSHQMALYVFLMAATFIALNSELHRDLYAKLFGSFDGGVINKSILLFLRLKTIHLVIFSPVIWVFIYFYLGDIFYAFAFVFLIIFEKIWDEAQRFYIFAKKYGYWSMWYLLKSICLILAAFIAISFSVNFIFVLSLFMLIFSILLLYFLDDFVIMKYLSRIAFKPSQTIKVLGRYARKYRDSIFLAQLSALAGANILQLDKWILEPIVEKKFFVELVLACQIGSIILIAIDILFLAVNRVKYINSQDGLGSILNWGWMLFVAVIYLSIIFFGGDLILSLSGFVYISSFLLVSIAGVFTIYGLTAPFAEFVFWRYPRHYSALSDLFILFFAFLLLMFNVHLDEPVGVYAVLGAMYLIRLIYYSVLAISYKNKFLIR